MAALGVVTKPYLRMPFSFVQTSFGMPVGTFIGGLYMFWPVLAGRLVPRPGAVLVTCALQGLVAILTGFTGLLGPMAFFSYLAPGLVIEGLYWAVRRVSPAGVYRLPAMMAAAALGNAAGALTNALLFFALRGAALSLAMGASMLTGAGGGWLAYLVGARLPRPTAPAAAA